MMNYIRELFVIAAVLWSVAVPTTVFAVTTLDGGTGSPTPTTTTTTDTSSKTATSHKTVKACSNDKSILLFPAWFHNLKCETLETTVKDKDGNVLSQYSSETVQLGTINDTWVIVMNIVQWLIIAGGYVSLYFIIWSGFKYITATGDPQKITAAKNTITNAVIGLIIVLASVAIVRTIQAAIGGTIT